METSENKLVASKREATLKRLKAKHPEDNYDDEEVLFGRINGDYDDYDSQISERDKRLARYAEDEKRLADMFASDPRSAKFLTDWSGGQDPAIALIREFGNDIRDIIDDPARQEEVAKANKEFAERVAKEKEYDEEYRRNLEASLAYLDELKSEGMSDDEIDSVMEFIITIVRDGLMGKFTPETIELARKAVNHDSDVAEAGEEGVIKGRNERIEERLRKGRKGDGTASLGGNNAGAAGANMPDMGALDRFGGSDDIWRRGGEKRTSYKDR